MGDPVVVEFFGGPFDGQVRQIQEKHPTIEVPMISKPPLGSKDDSIYRVGRYRLVAHTKFGDPWRYEWEG